MTHTDSTKKTRNFSIKDDVFGSLSGLIAVGFVIVAICFFGFGWALFAQSVSETPTSTSTATAQITLRGCPMDDIACVLDNNTKIIDWIGTHEDAYTHPLLPNTADSMQHNNNIVP